MSRKILGICAALVALAALAIPASASAAPTLRDTVGTELKPLAVGAKITALSEGTAIFKAGSAEVKCNENWMTGEVHVNNDTEGITGTITAAAFESNLTSTGTKCDGGSVLGPTTVDIPALAEGKHWWCIKNVAGTDNFEVLGRGCTEKPEPESGTLTFGLTGNINCWYKREAGVNGTFTTTSHPEPATLSVTGNPKFVKEVPSSFLCPNVEGEITEMKFKLYTDKATESESTANPVEIAD